MKKILVLFLLYLTSTQVYSVSVNGYYRSNGTYVRSHTRSSPSFHTYVSNRGNGKGEKALQQDVEDDTADLKAAIVRKYGKNAIYGEAYYYSYGKGSNKINHWFNISPIAALSVEETYWTGNCAETANINPANFKGYKVVSNMCSDGHRKIIHSKSRN